MVHLVIFIGNIKIIDMKLIFGSAFCLVVVLTVSFVQISKQDKQKTTQEYVSKNVSFVVVDNCQYIVSNYRPLVLTHKGNCTNHIH